jgi:hypothetical protein
MVYCNIVGVACNLRIHPHGICHRVHILVEMKQGHAVYLPTQLERTLQLYW